MAPLLLLFQAVPPAAQVVAAKRLQVAVRRQAEVGAAEQGPVEEPEEVVAQAAVRATMVPFG